MSLTLAASLAAIGLFLGMLVFFEVGRRIGLLRRASYPEDALDGSGTVEGAIFGLLGLLLAFTFSGAATRFEERRHLVTQEANAIGTAHLRIDLMPADAQPPMRALFRRYVETRLQTYRQVTDWANTQLILTESSALQSRIWASGLSAVRRPEAPPSAAMLLLPALNDMFDITTTRLAATRNHPPEVILLMLIALSCVSAMLVGHSMSGARSRNWFHLLTIATTMAITLYVILDLEYPRLGLIRVDAADQTLVELRNSMG